MYAAHKLAELWRRLLWPGLMKDADRLITAQGQHAYGLAKAGARSNDENGRGYWNSVASEIGRRLGRKTSLTSRCL